VRRRGKLRALVDVARSILVIIWRLLADPAIPFREITRFRAVDRYETCMSTID
jgi:hypothetical protein